MVFGQGASPAAPQPPLDGGTELMLVGIMLLWFAEVVASFAFVASDIARTPESPVLKWGFVIVTLFTGPIGLVLYILSCREALPGVHADYVRARLFRVLGLVAPCGVVQLGSQERSLSAPT